MPTFPYPRAKLRFALKIFCPAFLKKAGGFRVEPWRGPGWNPDKARGSTPAVTPS